MTQHSVPDDVSEPTSFARAADCLIAADEGRLEKDCEAVDVRIDDGKEIVTVTLPERVRRKVRC